VGDAAGDTGSGKEAVAEGAGVVVAVVAAAFGAAAFVPPHPVRTRATRSRTAAGIDRGVRDGEVMAGV
jgi:hypothetical protein